MSGIYSDTASRLARVAPQIRPAGVAGDYNRPSVRDLTSSYSPDACDTPDAVKKFGHRGGEVGESLRHYGLAADAPADRDVRYGVTAKDGFSVDECLRPGMYRDKMASLVGEQREKNCVSERQRPLGRCPEPTYPVSVPLDGFGAPTRRGESTASTIAAMRDVEVRHPAAVQTTRGYDWQATGIDPTQYRFGSPTTKGENTREALRGEARTVLVPSIVRDYKSTVDHEVGKPRSYGFDNPADWDESKRGVVSGMKPRACNGFQSEQPTVRELLSTWAEDINARDSEGVAEGSGLQKDSTFSGTSSGDGLRATVSTTTRKGHEVRALEKLEDDATAQQLVHPCHYVNLGVQSAYFAGGRDLENVRALANKCDFGMTDAQIDEVFADNAIAGLCGIEQFKNAAFAKGYM